MRLFLILLVLFGSQTALSQQKDETETIEELILEGYYANQFENSSFYVLNGNTLENKGWLFYSKPILSDSTMAYVTEQTLKSDYKYIKFKGTKKTGKRYGHFGAYKFEYTATDIIATDSTNTLNKFLHDQIKKKGYAIIGDEKLTFPESILPDNQLVFTSTKDGYNFILKIKQLDEGSISYKLSISGVRESYNTDGIAILEKNYLKSSDTDIAQRNNNMRYVLQIGNCRTYIYLSKGEGITASVNRYCYDQPFNIWPNSGLMKVEE